MPYIQLSISHTLTATDKQALVDCVLSAAALLNKSRSSVMVHILDSQALTKGDEAGECAFCDVRVLGAADRNACDRFSQALSADIARISGAAPANVYLTLSELSLCYAGGCLPPGHSR